MTIADYPKLIDRWPAPEDDEDLYPSSDGEPMGETLIHVILINQTMDLLSRFFAGRPDVLVAGNNFVYYTRGRSRDRVSPDTYVVSGVTRPVPKSFFTWLHDGMTPNIVFEFASEKTWANDSGPKKELYQNVLRVGEYIQFDPTGEYLKPRLLGYRLVGGQYVPIKAVDGRIRSEFLGLEMFAEDTKLRFFDPRTHSVIPNGVELDQIAAAEKRRADEEKIRADEANERADNERQQRLALEAKVEALERQGKLS